MPGHYWDGSSWKTLTSAHFWDGSSWRTINSGWYWDASSWKQIYATGTFQPEIRDGGGVALSYRNVGVALVGYRGYSASGTSTFQWQYSLDNGVTWSNQTGTGNSGTYAAATLTTNYTTDTFDVQAMESIFLNSNDLFYMRLRVTRLGETQFSQSVRVGKRIPINNGSTLSLLRTSSGLTYTLTGASNERNPYPNDQVFWTPNFTSTTNITNDTRPDYYIFTFTTNSGVTQRDSRMLDVSNPRNPLNARRYTVQNSDIGGPIVCDMNAWNSNENAPRVVTVITRPVSTNVLIAPINLVSSFVSGSIVGTWDAASGGNDTTITYVAYLFQNGSLIHTSASSTATTFSFVISGAGDFRFYVIATQSGSSPVQSEFSNTTTVQAPAAFSASIENVTSQYPPGDFSISAPTLSATVLNEQRWNWGVSSNANFYDSQITRPNGTTLNTNNLTGNSLSLTIAQTGNYTQRITAKNLTTNYVRLSWTKPFGTSAVSYRVVYNRRITGTVTPITVNVDDVTFIDVTIPYNSDPVFNTGNSIILTSVTAYSGLNQTGVSTIASRPTFPDNSSIANQISTRAVSRTDFLALENPTAGSLTVVGIPEPGQQISLVAGTGWSPAYENWSKTYDWIRSGVTQPETASTNAAPVISATGVSIGNEFFCVVDATYKGFNEVAFSSTILVVPAPPTYNITDTFSQRFQISGVSSISATQYYGSYSGVGFGTIPETTLSSTFTSPQLSVGNVSVDLYARKRVNIVYPTTQNNVPINSTRFTTQSVSLQAAPQSTGQQRLLTPNFSVTAGQSFSISTNGYLGYASGSPGTGISVPSDGSWLNIAQSDLQQQYLYFLSDTNGLYIRWRGNQLGSSSQVLEYQTYHPWDTAQVYVYFIENTLNNYLVNNAWYVSGSVQTTYINNSVLNSSIGLVSLGSMTRVTTRDGVDDNVTVISPTRVARPLTSNPTVTRLAGGYSFNVTDASTGTFDSASTYTVTTAVGTGTPTINTSTGLVIVTGVAASAFHSTRVQKTRFGFTTVETTVQGQALAGAPATQITSMTFNGISGTFETAGTPRRAQVGAVLSGSAGTYNNQQSISSGILTILSNSYTGADSNWTGTTPFGTSVTMSTAQASQSANMYRWRDRVTGTDGSVTDFYSSAIFRAVYAPPPGGTTTTTQNSITISYTGGSGPQRYYRFLDGSNLGFVADGGAGPFVASFTGLTADTLYNAQLFSGNNEGFLSIGFLGGSIRTSPNKLSTPTGVAATTTRTDGINVTWSAVAGAAYYGIWFGPVPSIDSAPDFGGPNNAGGWNGLGTAFLDTSVTSGSNRVYYVQAYASGNPAGTKSDYSSPGVTGTRVSAGTAPSGGSVSLSPSGTVQARTTITASVTAMSGTATITYFTSIRKRTGAAPTSITDGTEVASGTGTGNVASHTITDSEAAGTPDQFRAFTTGTNSIGSNTVSSNTVVSTPFVPVVTAPGTPTLVTSSFSGSGTGYNASVTWAAGSGGTPTSYTIFAYQSNGNPGTNGWIALSPASETKTGTSTSRNSTRSDTTWIQFRISATNSGGTSGQLIVSV
jgi:hypothetical protein